MKKRISVILLVLFTIVASAFTFGNTYMLSADAEDLSPGSSDFYHSLGNKIYEKGDQENAVKLWLVAVEKDPMNEGPLSNLGVYYAEQKDFDLAEDYLQRSLRIDPYNEIARMNLALIYNYQGLHDEAIQQLLVLLKIDESNPSYHYDLAINMADLYRKQGIGDLNDAIAEFRKADELKPGFAKAKENIKALKEVLAEEAR